MANLLADKSSREDFPSLDPEQLSRFGARLRSVVQLSSTPERGRQLERRLHSFDASLEELQSEATLVAAYDLLDGVERQRQLALAEGRDRAEVAASSQGNAPGGEIVCHWPGRSLSTGEANVASRGFYDLLDRPPLALWLEAIARPTGRSVGDFEVAILAWVPPAEIERARAGCLACKSGAVAMLESASEALARQLGPFLAASAEA